MSYWKLNPQRVRALVRERELKCYWVAQCAGVHRTTLRRWLQGSITRVQARNVVALAQILDVPRSDIAQRC